MKINSLVVTSGNNSLMPQKKINLATRVNREIKRGKIKLPAEKKVIISEITSGNVPTSIVLEKTDIQLVYPISGDCTITIPTGFTGKALCTIPQKNTLTSLRVVHEDGSSLNYITATDNEISSHAGRGSYLAINIDTNQFFVISADSVVYLN